MTQQDTASTPSGTTSGPGKPAVKASGGKKLGRELLFETPPRPERHGDLPLVSKDPPFRIACLMIEGFALMSFAAATEPLRAANFIAGRQIYDVTYVSSTESLDVQASSGATVTCSADLSDTLKVDMVLVISGWIPQDFDAKRVCQWLRGLERHGVALGGVSGGPLVLAMAGVMEGYRMTAHWEHLHSLGERYPSLLLERSLYVIDRKRVTCAGGVAPLDLMHALIAERHGTDFARKVSDWYMHTEVRPSGGQQRAGLVERYGTHSPPLIAALELMENHIADPLELDQIADTCGVSSRQLNRLFREQLDQSTMSFYRDMRTEIARNLLAKSTLSITEIALATGFANSAHFSQTFRSRYGIAPSTLREE